MAIQIPFPMPGKGFALNSKVRVNLDFIVAKFNEFNTGAATWDTVAVGTPASATGTVTFWNATNAYYLTVQAGTTAANTTYTLPTTAPAGTNQILLGTTPGTLSWSTHQLSTAVNTNGAVIQTSANNLGTAAYTGVSSRAALIMDSAAGQPIFVDLKGTTNQITITNNATDSTFSLPQDIGTSSTVTFAGNNLGVGSITDPSLFFGNISILGDRAGFGAYIDSNYLYFTGHVDTSPGQLDTVLLKINHSGTIFPQKLAFTDNTTNTITFQAPAAVTSYTLTLPTTDGDANQVLTTDGSGVLSWTAPSSGANTALSNLASTAVNAHIIPNTDSDVSLGSSSKYWYEIYGDNIYASNSLNAGKSGLAGDLYIYPSTSSKGVLKLVAADNSGDTITTITNASQAAARTYTIPDAGNNASFVMTEGTQTINGSKTFTTNCPIKGTTTNDSAASGYIGEYVESVISTFQTITNNVTSQNLTSISLTAGDWDVTGMVTFTINGSNIDMCYAGISLYSGSTDTDRVQGKNWLQTREPNVYVNTSVTIANYRISISSTTTVYLKVYAEFTSGNPKALGTISARRVR